MPIADYKRVVEDVVARIRSGDLNSGDLLPSMRKMAERYEVSVSTIRRALDILQDRGLVEGHQGKHTRVADPLPPGTQIGEP